MKSSTKFRIAETVFLAALEITVMPYLVKCLLLLQDPDGFMNWVSKGWGAVFKAWGFLFSDKLVLQGFVIFQLASAFLIFRYVWYPELTRRKNSKKVNEKGGPEAAGQGEFGTSRWQTEEEKNTRVSIWYTDEPINKGGIVLGMKLEEGREKIWYVSADEHTLMVAASRKGKDRRIYLPSMWMIAHSGESMVNTDPKGDMYITAKPFLEKMDYNTVCLNFNDPLKGDNWNVMGAVNKAVKEGNISKASSLAWDIANKIIHSVQTEKTEPIWIQGAESTIAALVLLTAMEAPNENQKHMTSVYYTLIELGSPVKISDDLTIVPLVEYMRSLPMRHPAKAAFATAMLAHEKGLASFFMSVSAYLRLFADPYVSTMTSSTTFDLDAVGLEKTAVFIIIPDDATTYNFLVTLFIEQLYQASKKLADSKGGRLPRRIHVIGNEWGNIPAVKDFDTKLTVSGGRGIRFHLGLQDLQQLHKHYGKNANTIIGNCHTLIYFATGDNDTAEYISKRTSKYTIETHGTSSNIQVSQGNQQSVGDSTGLAGRSLLDMGEILTWDPAVDGNLILPIGFYPTTYPIPDLVQYKANADFGLTPPSGDKDADIKANAKILMERWEAIQSKICVDVPIWIPGSESTPTQESIPAEVTPEPQGATPKTRRTSGRKSRVVLIKTNKSYYYFRENKLYSFNIEAKEMIREATDYSLERWTNYVKRMTDANKSVNITDKNIISQFEQKAEEIDASPGSRIQFDLDEAVPQKRTRSKKVSAENAADTIAAIIENEKSDDSGNEDFNFL